ncbi:C1q-like domain-containing protein [Aquipseudomonas alcaligenes]|uniref:C1q domain-containing protein n=1 Tax=Aquipseudomonas alcaligenes TaxID=43263 RepID=A0AA42N3A5_AQUAC|nr:hypothetical protein [Pseudomonas alcaligenes]MDH1055582.1 hypothetical protein [Pseudomonas alcaligenes]
MANVPETPDYPAGIYQLETNDPVLGGPGGIANRQAEQLANRTAWLKAKIDAFIDGTVAVLKATKLATARTLSISGAASGSTSFDGSANANIALTLADSGAVAGTYPKVTINAKGLVTGGAALVATDIPSLDWSKINSGKPTTLGGYGITDAQPLDATLTALAAQVTAANQLIYSTGVDAFAMTALTAFARTLLDDADAATMRTTLGAQPLDATLTALAAQVTAANQLIYSTGVDAFAMTALTAFARTLLDDADAATARATLGAASQASLDALGYFHAYQSAGIAVSAGAATLMRFQTEVADTLGAYAPATGIFTAPADGTYEFFASVHGGVVTTASSRYLDLYLNDTFYRRLQEHDGPVARAISGGSGSVVLSAGDTVKIYYGTDVAHTTNNSSMLTWFTGRRVK